MILAIMVLCQCARASVCVCVRERGGEREVVIDSFIYPFFWLCDTLFIVKHSNLLRGGAF